VTAADEQRDHPAADHAGGACDEDFHRCTPLARLNVRE
jgi:hypothetical protein